MSLIIRNIIWRKEYMDSLRLMRISNKTARIEGVDRVAVVMGTPLNKQILREVGLLTEEGQNADADAMIVGLAIQDEGRVQEVLDFIKEEMQRELERTKSLAGYTPKTLESALEVMPDANLALVSVPGQFAKAEAMKALTRGLHVFLFSDNVSIEEELALKKFAQGKGLLVMGPGCGTSIINGVALAFCNVVKKGPVGIVAAAGTGLQEVMSLVSNAGVGISHGIGTGGRDLSNDIGGITTRQGLKILEQDSRTEVIVLISKPPGSETAKNLLKEIEQMSKPVIVNFIGLSSTLGGSKNLVSTTTLEDAARKAIGLIRKEKVQEVPFTKEAGDVAKIAAGEYQRFDARQQYVRGLFSGGTICSEATLLLGEHVSPISSNMAPRPEWKMKDTKVSTGHVCIDLGDEEFTVGRAHPMIDPFVRQERLLQEAKDPETAVILLDIVLGYGSNEDMAGSLSQTIREAKSIKEKAGGYLSVVVYVLGTDEDPQNKAEQMKKLADLGVVVLPSNAQAARMAALIVTKGKVSFT